MGAPWSFDDCRDAVNETLGRSLNELSALIHGAYAAGYEAGAFARDEQLVGVLENMRKLCIKHDEATALAVISELEKACKARTGRF